MHRARAGQRPKAALTPHPSRHTGQPANPASSQHPPRTRTATGRAFEGQGTHTPQRTTYSMHTSLTRNPRYNSSCRAHPTRPRPRQSEAPLTPPPSARLHGQSPRIAHRRSGPLPSVRCTAHTTQAPEQQIDSFSRALTTGCEEQLAGAQWHCRLAVSHRMRTSAQRSKRTRTPPYVLPSLRETREVSTDAMSNH